MGLRLLFLVSGVSQVSRSRPGVRFKNCRLSVAATAASMSTTATAASMSTTATAGMSATTACLSTATAGMSATTAYLSTAAAAMCGRGMADAGAHFSSIGAMTPRCGMDSASAAYVLPAAAAAHVRSAPTASKMAMVRRITAAAAIVSSTTVTETMPAPAVAISPAGPWAHAKKNAVVEISRPVITVG